jgi:hypothetical protein
MAHCPQLLSFKKKVALAVKELHDLGVVKLKESFTTPKRREAQRKGRFAPLTVSVSELARYAGFSVNAF